MTVINLLWGNKTVRFLANLYSMCGENLAKMICGQICYDQKRIYIWFEKLLNMLI